MKRIKGLVLLVIVVLILGIIIGSQNSIGTNNYFEETKNKFEDEITSPNNTYEPNEIVVEGNALNKVAVKIDEKINSLIKSILDKIV